MAATEGIVFVAAAEENVIEENSGKAEAEEPETTTRKKASAVCSEGFCGHESLLSTEKQQ